VICTEARRRPPRAAAPHDYRRRAPGTERPEQRAVRTATPRTRSQNAAQTGPVRSSILAAAVLLLAVALRLPTLGAWSVWIDEAFTLHDARHEPPPYLLSYVLTEAVVAVLGDDEWALRVLPCLAGLAAVALLLRARPGANGDPRAPLLAAAILAVLPWHVFMSQNARHYALQATCLLAAFLAVDGRLSRAGRPRFLLAGVCLGAALACHPTAVFFAPGLLLVALRHLHGRARFVVVAAAAGIGALALAVYSPHRDGYVASKGAGSTLQMVASYGFLAGPAMLLCALVGCCARPRPVAELALLVPTALSFLAATRVLFLSGYHAFASIPLVALLAARGLLGVGRVARLALLVLLAAGIGWGLWLYHAGHGLRPRFREAAAWLANARADGCRLFATQPPPVAYYLGDRTDLRLPDEVHLLQSWTVADLEAALRAGPVAVLVLGDDLSAFGGAERAALDALLLRLPERREFVATFGPKDLTLHAHRSRP
jgi:hypothetical protein